MCLCGYMLYSVGMADILLAFAFIVLEV
jgi:hypothetical protein